MDTQALLSQPPVSMTASQLSEQSADCPLCRGDGYILGADRKANLCQCAIKRKIKNLLPQRYHRASLEDFHGLVRESITAWIPTPGDGLFLTGCVGTGKTHLAAAIVRHLVEIRVNVVFQRCAEFYGAVREMYRRGQGEDLLLSPLVTPRFLVLDDLGAGSMSDAERRFTLEVLDRRANRMKTTIVTSNWNLQEIAEKMDDRIASRLSGFARLELTGDDRRMRP